MALVATPRSDFQEIQHVQPDHVNVFFRFVDGQVSFFDDNAAIIFSSFRDVLILLFFADTLSLVGSGNEHCVH